MCELVRLQGSSCGRNTHTVLGPWEPASRFLLTFSTGTLPSHWGLWIWELFIVSVEETAARLHRRVSPRG